MSETMTAANGRPQRKQLSDQLDRLDGIIDVLADALPGAVADACREGARQAVKDAVVEILASPELRALIAGPAAARTAPPPTPESPGAPGPAGPGVWARIQSKLADARRTVAGRCRVAATAVTTAARVLASVLPPRRILAVGVGVGVAVGVVCYACPPALSAVVGGTGAACAAVAAQVGTWLRRATAALKFGGTS
jgi:hypothetical protein